MFYFHGSNKTENLLRQMAALIESDPQETIFDREYILIQSQGMERMISQYMADYFTSWCNYRFLLPLAFLEDIAEKLGMAIVPDSFARSHLTWRIEEKLRDIDSPVYAPLRQYLKGQKSELKRFQLARQLGHIFDQYQLMRPQMLKKWQAGKVSFSDGVELWQMDLWRRLTSGESDNSHRGDLLYEVIAALYGVSSVPELPQRVSVFGLHMMPPFFLDYLAALSQHCDVHLFLLSPCRQYWGDMRKGNEPAKTGAVAELHPLLINLGGQGREFQELLLDKVSFHDEFTSYEDPFLRDSPNLLHKLQSDLLAGRIKEEVVDFSEDDTIRIVSCHSQQRELEILKDHILDLLSGNRGLQLRDIVVMAPNIQEYGPLISAIFDDIQHSIADRSLHRRNVFVTLFQEFLSLLQGRFGWSEVLDLLAKEQISSHFGLTVSDCEKVLQWVVSAGVRWGLSEESRKKAGFSFYENSWQSGLERLLMGFAMDTEEEVNGIIPFTDIEGSDARSLGGICEFVTLLEHAVAEVEGGMKLSEWADLLTRYAASLFGSTNDRDFLELLEILRQLQRFSEDHGGEVGFETMRSWFDSVTKESRSVSGFLKGHLTFCSMLPMRSIPFAVVCLLGMNHGSFPKSEYLATFDLMKKYPKPGDRSVRADDRYQFLEALLSARQKLYISYQGQSLQDNKKLPPAVVVSELLDLLQNSYQVTQLIEHHPLHGFSSRYFREETALFSYNQMNLLVARTIQEGKKEEKDWWTGEIPVENNPVEFTDLLLFYSNPQLYFIQHCLGLSLGEESRVDENEVFMVAGLEGYLAEQALLQHILEDGDDRMMLNKLQHQGHWPLGQVGEIEFLKRTEQLRLYGAQIVELELGEKRADVSFSLRLGEYELAGKLTQLYENGILLSRYSNIKGRDLIRAWITHLVSGECGLMETKTHLMMKDGHQCFSSGSHNGAGLVELLDIYQQGRKSPLSLFIEPGLEYCRQKKSRYGRVDPLEKARATFAYQLEQGYEPAWTLLYRNGDVEKVIGDEFVRVCEKVLLPLWSGE